MSEEEHVQRGYRVRGRVQGVFFRAWTQTTAEELGLAGTVRNRRDGSVEAHVRGLEEKVRVFEARLWEGPPAASVDEVQVQGSDETIPPGRFQVLPTS